MSGRKRHIVGDTMGLLLAAVIHAANIQNRDGARVVLAKLLGRFPRLQIIWAGRSLRGPVGGAGLGHRRMGADCGAPQPGSHRFEVLPRRWVVERTLAWLSQCRRLSKDYEELPETGETWVYIAMVHLMLKRLKPTSIQFVTHPLNTTTTVGMKGLLATLSGYSPIGQLARQLRAWSFPNAISAHEPPYLMKRRCSIRFC